MAQDPKTISSSAATIAAHILSDHLTRGVRIRPETPLLDEIAALSVALARKIDEAAGA